jgi:hypothetical protein
LDGLALGIENGFLEGDVDVGCHGKFIIRQARVREWTLPLGLALCQSQFFVKVDQGRL